jgi:hypothetical protein
MKKPVKAQSTKRIVKKDASTGQFIDLLAKTGKYVTRRAAQLKTPLVTMEEGFFVVKFPDKTVFKYKTYEEVEAVLATYGNTQV